MNKVRKKICNLDFATHNLDEIKDRIASYISEHKLINYNDKVFIKPNFVAPFKHATTDPDLLCLVVEIILDIGGCPVIGESAGYEFETEKVFNVLEINDKLSKYNLKINNLDIGKFHTISTESKEFKKVEISCMGFDCDKIINMPKLKMHKVTTLSLAMKNLFGLYSRHQRQVIHIVNIHEGIIVINELIRPNLVILDASTMIMNAAVYGRAIKIDKIFLGDTNVGVDVYVCNYLNYPFQKIKYINDFVNRHNIEVDEMRSDKIEPDDKNIIIREDKYGNLKYKAMHILDYCYKELTKQESIIPTLHFRYGVRPVINREKCNLCMKCVEICPINALYVDGDGRLKINEKSCASLRCLKCIENCPEEAIRVTLS